MDPAYGWAVGLPSPVRIYASSCAVQLLGKLWVVCFEQFLHVLVKNRALQSLSRLAGSLRLFHHVFLLIGQTDRAVFPIGHA